MNTIRLEDYAWREGFQAPPDAVCPYPPGSTEAFSWASGQVEGAASRDKRTGGKR
jgi:hypothetical protein